MTAVVTGAGTGIGAAIARELGRRGHRVAVTDVNIDGGSAWRPRSKARRRFARRHRQSSIDAACDAACAALGPLEVWASNAGVSTMGRFIDLSEDEYDFNLAVNAKGVSFAARSRRDG